MDDSNSTLPPAGWYPDPAGSPAVRWWTGSAWTHDLRPAEDAGAEAPAASSAPVSPAAAPAVAAPAPVEPVPVSPAAGPAPVSPSEPGLAPSRVPPIPRDPVDWRTHAPSTRGSRVDSPNTLGVWLIALMPIIAAITWLGGASLTYYSPILAVAVQVSPIPLYFLLVAADRMQLARQRLLAPSLLWMLLPIPLVFLVVRRVVLRRQGVRSDAPWIVHLVLAFLTSALAAAAVVFLVLGSPQAIQGGLEASLAQSLTRQEGGAWSVVCPDAVLQPSQSTQCVGYRDGSPAATVPVTTDSSGRISVGKPELIVG